MALVAFGVMVRVYYNFCNQPRHTSDWVAVRIDAAIDRGLNFVHNTSAFTRPYADGGESPMHHFAVEQILRHQDHPGLRMQLELARKSNAPDGEWRKYYGLPGWPREELTDEDRQRIKFFVADVKIFYNACYLNALYPDWTQLPVWAHEQLYVHPKQLKTPSDLGHAAVTYYLLKKLWPEKAQQLKVEELTHDVNVRLRRIQSWAPSCGDGYHLRLATWQLQDERSPISQRWIERTLINQNTDGGWAWMPSYWRVAREYFGTGSFSGESAPHPSFLAVLSLTLYREQMRAAGTYPTRHPAP